MAGIVKKLDETVVNRMAAGEILQRPASALKEILENSLDAKSTNIQITVKAGGLKFLQVQDNGTGIRRENLEIVCERFTTSKLEKYDDLNKIATYGFRGEALASISHVAHLTILTKTDDDKCAYRATYEDGVLKNAIKPCAGNRGTQITVEDLFYNVTARKKALRSPAEEYQKIFEIVGNYAVHNHNVAISLKKHGENIDLKTPCNSNSIDNIRIVFGNAIARELMKVEISDDHLKLKMNGLVSNVNYSNKKGTLLLFINHRLVESSNLKKAIEAVYATYLPKNGHPFAYLSIELDPQNVDVNVHPTKHEVHFLYEEQIIEKITKNIETVLLKCSTSRVMYTQALLPGAKIPDLNEVLNSTSQKTLPPQHFVRTDSTEQKLDKFFGNLVKECDNNVTIINDASVGKEKKESEEEKPSSSSSFSITAMANVPQHSVYINPKESFKTRQFSSERNETKLTSVLKLRLQIEKNCSNSLREILANLVFIGFVDLKRTIIQHSTKMYLCNTSRLMEELFYQILMYDFQNFGQIKFTTPLSTYDLALIALELPDNGWTPEDGDKSELATNVKDLLISKGPMLLEYYSLEIDSYGYLKSLPLLLEKHSPFMGALPNYILQLATEVNWDSEKDCFETFSKCTAKFYSRPHFTADENIIKNQEWIIEHCIFPALRKYFIPPKEFTENGVILQIANLPDLYKVFERC